MTICKQRIFPTLPIPAAALALLCAGLILVLALFPAMQVPALAYGGASALIPTPAAYPNAPLVAHAMGQSLPAISQRISALESLGCVERVNDPRDRRVSAVRLTQAGHALLEQGYANMKQKLSQAMEAIGPENLTLLLELLERMAAQLEKLAAADAGPAPGGAGRAEQEK